MLVCETFSQMRKPEKKENKEREMRLIARIEASNVGFILFYLAGMAGTRAGIFDLFFGELWYIKGFASKSGNLAVRMSAMNVIDNQEIQRVFICAYMKYKHNTKNRLGFFIVAITRIDA